jgi:hypothetical protein
MQKVVCSIFHLWDFCIWTIQILSSSCMWPGLPIPSHVHLDLLLPLHATQEAHSHLTAAFLLCWLIGHLRSTASDESSCQMLCPSPDKLTWFLPGHSWFLSKLQRSTSFSVLAQVNQDGPRLTKQEWKWRPEFCYANVSQNLRPESTPLLTHLWTSSACQP